MQQQVIEQAFSPPPSVIYESCTPTLDGEWVHWRRTGFLGICKWVKRNADALRFFEVKTNQRIYFLRERYGIPMGYLPTEEYLWIDGDEAALREIEPVIGWTYRKSSLSHCLREHAEEGQKPSLIEQKFLRSRYIARLSPGGAQPETVIWHEERWNSKRQSYVVPLIFCGEFGDYEGFDGAMHNAVEEGHIVLRQFLYEVEAVNQALYAWKFLDSPPPKERWMPVQVRQKGSAASASADESSQHWQASGDPKNKSQQTSASTSQGVEASVLPGLGRDSTNEIGIALFKKDDTISGSTMQRHATTLSSFFVNFQSLRTAPWTAETLMALSSKNLAIPDPATCDEDLWERDWGSSHWQRLIEMTKDLDPRLAWEHIDIVEQYMETPGSPSWWQRSPKHPEGGRTTKVPVTARNVADRFEEQYKDYQRRSDWYPACLTPYDGPPLLPKGNNVITADYSAGYGGVETSAPTGQVENVTQASPVIEVTAGAGLVDDALDRSDELVADEAIAVASEVPEPSRIAMSSEEALALAKVITARYPEISLEFKDIDDDDVELCIEHAPDRWLTLRRADQWYNPAPMKQRLIEKAVKLAESRARPGNGDDERGPPGDDVGEEVREGEGEAVT